MFQTKAQRLTALILMVGLGGFAHAKQEVFATFSGSSLETGIDEDPAPGAPLVGIGGDVEMRGNSRALGRFTARGRTDLGPIVLGVATECDGVTPFNPMPPHLGGSNEVQLVHAAAQLVFTAANDDLLYAVMADPADGLSTICASRIGEGFEGTMPLEVRGGTGRFSEADGRLVLHLTGNPVFNPRTARSHGTVFTGTIEEG